jgi:hypothetical protein
VGVEEGDDVGGHGGVGGGEAAGECPWLRRSRAYTGRARSSATAFQSEFQLRFEPLARVSMKQGPRKAETHRNPWRTTSAPSVLFPLGAA